MLETIHKPSDKGVSTSQTSSHVLPVMTSEQLRREASYHVSIGIMNKLLSDGMITKSEARRIEQIAGQKYPTIWGNSAPLIE